MSQSIDAVVLPAGLRRDDDFEISRPEVIPFCGAFPLKQIRSLRDFKLTHMRPLTKISLFGVRLATCVLAIYWLLLFTGTHIPTIPKFAPRMWDKAQHFGAFFGLALLLCWVIPTRHSAWQKFLTVAVIAMLYGAFDELTQGFVRGRSTDIRDFIADSLGIWTAISVYALCRWLNLDPARFIPAQLFSFAGKSRITK
jgi:VanZ family protein